MRDRSDEKRKIFIVDDEPAITDSLSAFASMLGLAAKTYSSAADFLEYAQSEHLPETACLIVDVRMPQMSGLELIEKLIALGKQIPAIVITGHGDNNLKLRAKELGVVAFLEKPFRPDDFKEIVLSVLGTRNEPRHPQ